MYMYTISPRKPRGNPHKLYLHHDYMRHDCDRAKCKSRTSKAHPRLCVAWLVWQLTHGWVRHEWRANREINCSSMNNKYNPDRNKVCLTKQQSKPSDALLEDPIQTD